MVNPDTVNSDAESDENPDVGLYVDLSDRDDRDREDVRNADTRLVFDVLFVRCEDRLRYEDLREDFRNEKKERHFG